MTLYVHHGSRLAGLAHTLAGLLADPLDDPFETEVVAVPTAGVREYLTRGLAQHLGVAANIAWHFPARFVEAALGGRPDDPWAIEPLTLAVLAELDAGAVAAGDGGRALGDPTRRYRTARRIADRFDHYGVHRPEMLRAWHAGHATDAVPDVGLAGLGGASLLAPLAPAGRWQYELWRRLAARIDAPDPGTWLAERIAALRDGTLEPVLPRRVAWVGMSAIPPARLAVLEAVAQHRDVHVLIVRPSRAVWARATALPPTLTPRRQFTDQERVVHPLSRSWAAPATEMAALVNGLDGAVVADIDTSAPAAPELDAPELDVSELDAPELDVSEFDVLDSELLDPELPEVDGAPSRGDRRCAAGGRRVERASTAAGHGASVAMTLLGQIHDDIRADRRPTRVAAEVAGDGSLQVHACHGAIRQLEVLRDALAARFSADSTLRPDDVIVLTPDVARFAPWAAAIFGRAVVPLPVTVSDLSLGTTTPVAAALAELVRLASSRCRASEIVALLGRAPVRRRLGLGAGDVDQIAEWARSLATSWGLTADHRAGWLGDAADIAIGSWRATVDALLAGALMSAPQPRRTFGGLTPFDDITPATAAVAGRLADALARLDHARQQLAGERPVAEWCDVLAELLGMFCDTEPDDRWQLEAVLGGLARIRAAAADVEALVGSDEVVDLLDDALVDERGRLRLGTGRITLTGLVPLRNVPARVVALLGFDDEHLGVGAPDRDDLLAVRPCVGENDQRMERRQAILDALLAAEDTVIVTCDGQDRTTNRHRQFAVPLAELLETVAAMDPVAIDGADPQVVVRHPLRAHDHRNFTPGALVGVAPFGFDPTALRIAAGRSPASADPTRTSELGPAHDPARSAALDRAVELRQAGAPAGSAAPRVPGSLAASSVVRSADDPDGWGLATTVPATATLADLAQSLTRPHLTYLRHGLDVSLPPDPERADEAIPLWLDRLDQVGRGRELVDMLRQAVGDNESDWETLAADLVPRWRGAATLRADIPPGRLADSVLGEVEAEVRAVLDAAECTDLGLSPRHFLTVGETIDIDLSIDATVRSWSGGIGGATGVSRSARAPAPAGVTASADDDAAFSTPVPVGLAVQLRDRLAAHDAGGRRWICTLEYAALRDRYLMRAALDVAAAMIVTDRVDWAAAIAVRAAGKRKVPGVVVVDPASRHGDPAACLAAARRLLAVAAGVHVLAGRDRVPLFESASRPMATGTPLDEDVLWGTPYSTGDLASPEARFVWGDTTLSELVDRRPTPTQLAELVWGAYDDFVGIEQLPGESA